jgi:gas vesicle protein
MVVKNKTQLFFLGVGIGLAVGLSAGLLFAPTSGEKTRRLLRKEAKKGQQYLAELSDSVSEMGRKVRSV